MRRRSPRRLDTAGQKSRQLAQWFVGPDLSRASRAVMAVASRWPQRFFPAASISRPISRSVRYSRGREDRTVTICAAEASIPTCAFAMSLLRLTVKLLQILWKSDSP